MTDATCCSRLCIAVGAILFLASDISLSAAQKPALRNAVEKDAESSELLQRRLYARTIDAAWLAWKHGEISRARQLLKSTDPRLRSWDYDYLNREFADSEPLLELPDLSASMGIRYVTFSPDGTLLAACSDDLHVRAWDFSNDRQLLFDVKDETRTVEFDPTGQRLVTGLSGRVKIRDSRSGKIVDRFGISNSYIAGIPLRAQFSASGESIAVHDSENGIHLFDAVSTREKHFFQDSHFTDQFRFSPVNEELAIVTTKWIKGAKRLLQYSIEVYDVSGITPALQTTIQLDHWLGLSGLDFSPDGRKLAVCGGVADSEGQGQCTVFDIATGKKLAALTHYGSYLTCVRFNGDGTKLATGAYDSSIQLWNAQTGARIDVFRGHTNVVRSIAFSPDGRRLASGSRDGTLRLWNLDELSRSHQTRILVQFENDLSLTQNGRRTYTRWRKYDREAEAYHSELKITGTRNGTSFPDVRSDDEIQILSHSESHDGRWLAQSLGHFLTNSYGGVRESNAPSDESDAGTVHITDRMTGESISEISCEHRLHSLAFSPDDRFLYTAGPLKEESRSIRGRQPAPVQFEVARWEAATGNPLFRKTVDVDNVLKHYFKRLMISPDGTVMAAAVVFCTGLHQWKSVIYLFDAQTGETIGELVEPETMNLDYQFSPDGRRLAVAVLKDTSHKLRGYVSIWELRQRQKTQSIPAYETNIHAVAFTPDGHLVVSGGNRPNSVKGEVTFWDPVTGERVFQIDDFPNDILRLAFDPEDRSLIAVGRRGTISVLEIE